MSWLDEGGSGEGGERGGVMSWWMKRGGGGRGRGIMSW